MLLPNSYRRNVPDWSWNRRQIRDTDRQTVIIFRLKYFDDPDISYKQKHDNINRNYTPAIFFGDGYILDKSEKDITYSNIEIKNKFHPVFENNQ